MAMTAENSKGQRPTSSERPSKKTSPRTAPTREKKRTVQSALLILTIGHSTRSAEDFLRLLHSHQVHHVVDIRTIPRSRHNPQFNSESLAAFLKTNGIHYTHLPGLGGLRHTTKASVNLAWRNTSFRGFADYMQTPEFEHALEDLIHLAQRDPVALMCAEAVPWRCHRSLVADALTVRKIRVEHIMNFTRRERHTLTPFAKVRGQKITYPARTVAK